MVITLYDLIHLEVNPARRRGRHEGWVEVLAGVVEKRWVGGEQRELHRIVRGGRPVDGCGQAVIALLASWTALFFA
jgi:hypothetical protein